MKTFPRIPRNASSFVWLLMFSASRRPNSIGHLMMTHLVYASSVDVYCHLWSVTRRLDVCAFNVVMIQLILFEAVTKCATVFFFILAHDNNNSKSQAMPSRCETGRICTCIHAVTCQKVWIFEAAIPTSRHSRGNLARKTIAATVPYFVLIGVSCRHCLLLLFVAVVVIIRRSRQSLFYCTAFIHISRDSCALYLTYML